MATANTTKPYHDEHPPSGFVDPESTLGTLYNISNVMGLIGQHIDINDLDPVEITGVETIYKECLRAIAFESVRLSEGNNREN
mgnify:CR=1 FL=1